MKHIKLLLIILRTIKIKNIVLFNGKQYFDESNQIPYVVCFRVNTAYFENRFKQKLNLILDIYIVDLATR